MSNIENKHTLLKIEMILGWLRWIYSCLVPFGGYKRSCQWHQKFIIPRVRINKVRAVCPKQNFYLSRSNVLFSVFSLCYRYLLVHLDSKPSCLWLSFPYFLHHHPYLWLICTSPVSAVSSEWTSPLLLNALPATIIFLSHSTCHFSTWSFALVSCKSSVSSSGIKVLLDFSVLILQLFVWLLSVPSTPLWYLFYDHLR